MRFPVPNRSATSIALALTAVVAGSVWLARSPQETSPSSTIGSRPPVPVELAPVGHGVIRDRRTFAGTLEANARFVVAPKVGGRITRITVELGNRVQKGQLVAEIDDAEYRQAVAEARAELAVARAQVGAVGHTRDASTRAFERVSALQSRGVASAQELDAATATKLEAQAAVEVARARVARASAALRAATVRAESTQVRAEWPAADVERIVAERFADEGHMIAANSPLLSIVDLDPVVVVVHVPQADYAVLAPEQAVQLTTDAYPGRVFDGAVARIAPVFDTASRQARVEIRVDNVDHTLRPGMFVRAAAIVGEVENAAFVPQPAIVSRSGQDTVFVACDDNQRACARPVVVGVRDGDNVEVRGRDVTGQVIVVGQHQLEDGAEIRVTTPPVGVERDGQAASTGEPESKS